jgi:hypothetical protein
MSENTTMRHVNKGLGQLSTGASFIGNSFSKAVKKTADSLETFKEGRSKGKERRMPTSTQPINKFYPMSEIKSSTFNGNPRFGGRKKTKRRKKKTKRRKKKTKRRKKKTKRRRRRRRS